MKHRLPFESKIINQSEVAYFVNCKKKETWDELATQFDDIITPDNTDEFEREVRMFVFQWETLKEDIDSFNKNYVAAWFYLSQDYPNLARLAQALLVFPYSSASVESSFSKLKGYKTLYRNRLLPETIEASMLMQQRDKKEQNFKITSGMKTNYSNMWKQDTDESKPQQILANSISSKESLKDNQPSQQNLKVKERLSQVFQSLLAQIEESELDNKDYEAFIEPLENREGDEVTIILGKRQQGTHGTKKIKTRDDSRVYQDPKAINYINLNVKDEREDNKEQAPEKVEEERYL